MGVKDQMEKAKKKQQQLAHQVETQNADIKKLESTIHDAETERQNQKREYENVISDRDILGTQLIRRNDELALLYEKSNTRSVSKKFEPCGSRLLRSRGSFTLRSSRLSTLTISRRKSINCSVSFCRSERRSKLCLKSWKTR